MTPADRTWCGPEGESGGGEGCVYKAEAKVAASNLSPSFAMNVLVSAVLSTGVSVLLLQSVLVFVVLPSWFYVFCL